MTALRCNGAYISSKNMAKILHAITVGVSPDSPKVVSVEGLHCFMLHWVFQSHFHIYEAEVVRVLQRVLASQPEVLKAI